MSAEVNQEAEFETGHVQVVENLGPVFVAEARDRLDLDDNLLKAHEVGFGFRFDKSASHLVVNFEAGPHDLKTLLLEQHLTHPSALLLVQEKNNRECHEYA